MIFHRAVVVTFANVKATSHTSEKSCAHESVRAQKNVSKGHPKITSKTNVVWSRTLECSVKSYVTGPSTKCNFNEFDVHVGPCA